MTAYIFPFFGIFWSMLFFYVWVMWIFLVVRTFAAIFSSDDLSGFSKALWIFFVIALPFLGVFAFMISHNNDMTRSAGSAGNRGGRYDDYSYADFQRANAATNASDSVASQLDKLAQLKASGVLTEAEFAAQKARLLG